MKITIDTKEDSKEEIKKIISLLQNLLNEPYSNLESKNEFAPAGMFNMFSDKPAIGGSNTADDLLKESDDSEEKEEKFEVETY